MKFQIIVKSCWRDKERGYHDAIRQTWGSDLWDRGLGRVLFVMGERPVDVPPSTVNWDEVALDGVDDSYDGLPSKTKAICKMFATLGGNEYIFLCDNDTFLIPERMAEIDLKHDYVGRFTPGPCEIGATFRYVDARGIHHPLCRPWASGGVGYFLSRKAAGIVAQAEITSWAEDLWVGQVLGAIEDGGITIGQPPDFECWAAWHWRRSKKHNSPRYETKWMDMMWSEYKQGLLR